jgi:NADH:ubiquinone oxidoreductase subunit B-like Fe-S oxidoreductase
VRLPKKARRLNEVLMPKIVIEFCSCAASGLSFWQLPSRGVQAVARGTGHR